MTGSRFNIRLEDGTSSETSRRSRETRGTMAEFRWIKTSLFLILVLQFTAAATGQRVLSFTVRDGDEVNLPCESLMDDQKNCNSTEWVFYNSRKRTVVVLAKYGKIVEEAKDKSDRLSVSEDGSLVIKKVTDEDGGLYNCKQFRSGRVPDAVVYLSVVTLTEHKDTEEVTVNCSVKTYLVCRHKVKWLLEGQDVDKDNKEVMTSQSYCSASLKFLTSHFFHTSRFNSLMCEVTDGDEVQRFPLRNSLLDDKTGEDTTTTEAGKTTTTSTISEDSPELQIVWWYVIVAVVLVALLIIIIIVAVIKWKRTKGNTTRTEGNELTSDPAPETSQDTTDPEEGVSYASVSYTKKTDGAAQGRSKHDDEVTYASVNTSSTNPSSLYSTVTIT